MQQTGLSELAKKGFNFKIIHGSNGNKPSTGSSTKGECVASKTDKSRNTSRKDARRKMGAHIGCSGQLGAFAYSSSFSL